MISDISASLLHELGQGAVDMRGAHWHQVAYDIQNSEHLRGMLAKVLTVLTILNY